MDHAETRDLAIAALIEFRDGALNDPATYAGGRAGLTLVSSTVQELLDRMQDTGAANPAYAPAHHATAALVALSATDPETYATFIEPVTAAYRGRPDIHPHSLDGLMVMMHFLQAVGDDHDWAVDPAGPVPVVRRQDHIATFQPTLTPRSLLATLEPLLHAASPAPAP